MLVSNKIAESQTLEYKRELPVFKDDDSKKEFLADITSFANSAGGDIIYGIDADKDGKPTEIVGLKSDLHEDDEILRLNSIVADGVEPRIVPHIQLRFVRGFKAGSVLIIRIMKSWTAPHMVGPKKKSRFYARHNTSKQQLDCSQIRSAFLLSDSVSERIRDFRYDRIAKILANETPAPLPANRAKFIVHILPFFSFANNELIDVLSLMKDATIFSPLFHAGISHRLNFDGYVSYCERAYSQIFRNGQVESVGVQRENKDEIYLLGLQGLVIDKVTQYITALKSLGIHGPMVIGITLLGVKGMFIKFPSGCLVEGIPIDRPNLLLPDILLENGEQTYSKNDVANLLKSAFDVLGQSAGFSGAVNYDDNGNWQS